MTNKEKEQYLNDLTTCRSQALLALEDGGPEDFCFPVPSILYKYRKFDKYTKEMLEEPYVYLSSTKNLDDPFDCLTNPGVDKNATEEDIKNTGLNMIDFVIEQVWVLGKVNIDKKAIKKVMTKCWMTGEFDEEVAQNALTEIKGLTEEQIIILLALLGNLKPMQENLNTDHMKKFAQKLINPSTIGVCSLSTKRDNKVMWSLYGNVYDGYCVEYEIPENINTRYSLYPVLYKRNEDNNLVHSMVKMSLGTMISFFSGGKLYSGVGSINELVCTKDTDWAYQDEWRLVGEAGDHCSELKVKAVFIGFKAKRKNISLIKNVAKRKNFKVFLMDTPHGKKKITYSEI